MRVERTGNLLPCSSAWLLPVRTMERRARCWRRCTPRCWRPTATTCPRQRPIVGAGPGRCDFYRHVDLPATYVPRPEVLEEIKAVLLAPAADGAAMALTSAIKMDALQGMGGIGKSVIARALCDDPDVQAPFPAGSCGRRWARRPTWWSGYASGWSGWAGPCAPLRRRPTCSRPSCRRRWRADLPVNPGRRLEQGGRRLFPAPGGLSAAADHARCGPGRGPGGCRAADPGDAQGRGARPAAAFDWPGV